MNNITVPLGGKIYFNPALIGVHPHSRSGGSCNIRDVVAIRDERSGRSAALAPSRDARSVRAFLLFTTCCGQRPPHEAKSAVAALICRDAGRCGGMREAAGQVPLNRAIWAMAVLRAACPGDSAAWLAGLLRLLPGCTAGSSV